MCIKSVIKIYVNLWSLLPTIKKKKERKSTPDVLSLYRSLEKWHGRTINPKIVF